MKRLALAALLAAACAPPASAPAPASAQPADERAVFQRINEARQRQGCTALQWSETAARVARAHSADMARRGYFSHVSPDGSQPGVRLSAAGVAWSRVAENIAHSPPGSGDVVALWMGSPGHRANIVNCAYTHSGVGESAGRWTQLFYTPR